MLEDSGELTGVGETVLLECIEIENKTPPPKDKELWEQFEELWLLFPQDDAYRNFPKTRDIRRDKEKSFEEYVNALERGIKHNDLITALRNEIAMRNKPSITNQFTFMRSPVNWLRKDTYKDNMKAPDIEEDNDYGKQVY